MGKTYILDCTLRDGGYINDWNFGEKCIRGFLKKIASTGIEMCEIGFIKSNVDFNINRTMYPDVPSMADIIQPKDPDMMYVGMIDMSAPVPFEAIPKYDGTSIDGIRVIFKKAKLEEGFEYCKFVKAQGYKTFAQFVGTDSYTDKEFIDAIEKFNEIDPDAVSIVDSFGVIKKRQFMRLVYLADNNMKPGIMLGYHAHNNLQQAMGNAQSMLELNLKRDICIDACVFGMGRGAGNLNLEIFAEYMNEQRGTQYRIEPMLEIMDEYLFDIYTERFWGYSLPLYLSATNGCHPNYSIYLQQKHTLTVRAFNELLRSIPVDKKVAFSKETAEFYYKQYMDNYIDDSEVESALSDILAGRTVLLLAPGSSLAEHKDKVDSFIKDNNPVVIAVNFDDEKLPIDYIFSSNMRRYAKIEESTSRKTIITSNMKEAQKYSFIFNYATYTSEYSEIFDNSGVMALKLLMNVGVKNVYIAGMDGYSAKKDVNYFDKRLEYDFSAEAEERNRLIGQEIKNLNHRITCHFLTPSKYQE